MIPSVLFITLIFSASVLLARLAGKYMAAVYKSEKNVLDFLRPLKNRVFKPCKIDPERHICVATPMMLPGRYVPIAGAIVITGILSQKTYTAPTYGTLKTDSYSFGMFTFFLIIILCGLSLLVSLLLGPLADYFYKQ